MVRSEIIGHVFLSNTWSGRFNSIKLLTHKRLLIRYVLRLDLKNGWIEWVLLIPRKGEFKSNNDEFQTALQVEEQFKTLLTNAEQKRRNLTEKVPSWSTLFSPMKDWKSRHQELKDVLEEFAYSVKHHNVTETVSKIVLGFLKNPFYAHNKFVSFHFWVLRERRVNPRCEIARVFEQGCSKNTKTEQDGIHRSVLGSDPTYKKHPIPLSMVFYWWWDLQPMQFRRQQGSSGGGHVRSRICDRIGGFHDSLQRCIIITAGYEDKMNERFFAANEGLDSRFHRFSLGNIGVDNLVSVVNHIVKGFGYRYKKEWESVHSSKQSIFDNEAFGFLKTMLSGIKENRHKFVGGIVGGCCWIGHKHWIHSYRGCGDIPSTLEG